MPSMTDSQFKTFRADVRREVLALADEIRRNIYESVVGESRKVAAAVVRKDMPQKIREEVDRAMEEQFPPVELVSNSISQTGPKVTVTIEADEESLARLETLEAVVAAQKGLIDRLMESREVHRTLIEELRATCSREWERIKKESDDTRTESSVHGRRTRELDQRLKKLEGSKEEPEIFMHSYGPGAFPPVMGSIPNGAACVHNGEKFIFWWGEWRRVDAVMAFSSYLRSTGVR